MDLGDAPPQKWFLMERYGECMEVQVLRRRVPDLGDIADPRSFANFMRSKGYAVTTAEVANGRAAEVNVPERRLSLLFVTTDFCRKPKAR
jgi:hypothetical protein